MTEHLDAALRAAHKAYGSPEDWPITDEDRQFARALIAHIIDHLEDKPMSVQAAFGYRICLGHLREIAGIEDEEGYGPHDGN